MKNAHDKWGLTVLAAYSQRWSDGVAGEFRRGVSVLLADVQSRIRKSDHPSLTLIPHYLTTGIRPSPQSSVQFPYAFAMLDASDYDEDLGLLAGFLQGAG